MNTYDVMFPPTSLLNEKIARQVFEMLVDDGPIFLIADKNSNSWPSDSKAFAKLNIDDGFLALLWGKIDDGAEPIITQTDTCSVIAAELATERTPCGYIAIFMRQDGLEPAIANISLLETIINLVNLIASLVEKNSLLYELQMRIHSGTFEGTQSGFALN